MVVTGKERAPGVPLEGVVAYPLAFPEVPSRGLCHTLESAWQFGVV